MGISEISDDVWTDVLLGKVNFEFECLAVKILLARLRIRLNTDTSPAAVQQCTAELKALFIKLEYLPSVKNDLGKMSRYRRVS